MPTEKTLELRAAFGPYFIPRLKCVGFRGGLHPKIMITAINVTKAREHRGEYNTSWDELLNMSTLKWPVPDPKVECPVCGK